MTGRSTSDKPNNMADHPDLFLLDHLMTSLKIDSEVVGRVITSEPLGIAFDPIVDRAKIMFVFQGSVLLEATGRFHVLEEGDFALCLAPIFTSVRTKPGIDAIPFSELLAKSNQLCRSGLVYQVGNAVPTHQYLTGLVQVRNLQSHPLIRSLPDAIIVRRDSGAEPIRELLARITEETESIRPGSRPIVNRLLDAVIMHAIRSYALSDGGWAGFLGDPEIGRVVARIHADPGADWTLVNMAKLAGLSRSTFADRFKKTVGQAPMSYLTSWRMHVAVQRLQVRNLTVSAVAAEVGYESESAFSRAFHREVGYRPGHGRHLSLSETR
ncbi:AraC-type transcription regulator, ligand-binding domain containing protein [Fimbriimonadaceae bacterium]